MLIILLLLSIALIILLTVRFEIHPFLALIGSALFYALLAGMPVDTILTSINEGFGKTLGGVGLVIIMGILIGVFLEETGGAYRLAEVVLKLIGEKNLHAAMGLIGYVVSIPVFADSGFVILNPLNKSLSAKAKVSLAGTGVALILGLMLTHTMVPPTPGPIAAAELLSADIGLVMLVGIVVSGLSLIVAVLYAKHFAGRYYIDPNPEMTPAEMAAKTKAAPSAFQSFLPILIPIILIVGKSIIEFTNPAILKTSLGPIIEFLGAPIIALIIGMLLAFMLPKKYDKHLFSTTGWVGKALKEASTIILITGAGGIFGNILRNSGIADIMAENLSGLSLGIILPFLLATAIKTAQGSSTVALITTASILAPLLGNLGFTTELQKAMVVIAIGAGSSMISHANDSGFWVVTQLTGMDVKTGYRLYSTGTVVVGLTAIILVTIGYSIFA